MYTSGITFQQVSKSFGAHRVLDQISFHIPPNKTVFILGKSGMGKSVILKHIVQLLQPDHGTILLNGQDITHEKNPEQLQKIRRHCAMIFQYPALMDSLNVFENIALGLRFMNTLSEPEIHSRITTLSAQMQLSPSLLSQPVHHLSYGEQKKISLARTFILEPQYCLLDEPTTGLDQATAQMIQRCIQEFGHRSQIIVSHDRHFVEQCADRILFLDQGHILEDGSLSQILQSPHPVIQQFFKTYKTPQARHFQ